MCWAVCNGQPFLSLFEFLFNLLLVYNSQQNVLFLYKILISLDVELYKMRNPVGRPRKYTPQELWETACKYFEWCDSHPWTKYEPIKSGADAGKLIEMQLKIPYTIEGL